MQADYPAQGPISAHTSVISVQPAVDTDTTSAFDEISAGSNFVTAPGTTTENSGTLVSNREMQVLSPPEFYSANLKKTLKSKVFTVL